MTLTRRPLALLLALASCVSVPEDRGLQDVQGLTAERLDQRLHWRRGANEDALVDAEVERLLASPLSADAAVQIALLENRALQAEYERLGLARADLIEASRLRNPSLSASARFPSGGANGANLEFGLAQGLLDFLLRPAREGIAETRLDQAQLSVAATVVEFATEVRRSYFMALGAKQVAALRKLVVDSAEASAELARRLHDAGNLSALKFAHELALYESARVAWARAEAESLAAREDLTRSLGVWGPRTAWTLPDSLPVLPSTEIPLERLEVRAVEGRLDLAAARKESEALARALGVTRDWRFLGLAEIGVSSERDIDGQWVTGPGLTLELPIFDQRQGELARGAAELRRADQLVIALAVEVRSEVRAARDRLLAQRGLVEHYRDVVVPGREAMVALTQQEYNYMLVGAFELIAAKQAEYDAYQEYVEAVRDYWISLSELDRALGGVRRSSALPSVPSLVEPLGI